MSACGAWPAALFVDPAFLSGATRGLLLLPRCLSVSVVYKTIKCTHVKEVPVASLILWATIVVGMYAVGVGMWAAFVLLS